MTEKENSNLIHGENRESTITVRLMSSSSSSHSSLFQSSKIGSSYISNRLAQVVWNDN